MAENTASEFVSGNEKAERAVTRSPSSSSPEVNSSTPGSKRKRQFSEESLTKRACRISEALNSVQELVSIEVIEKMQYFSAYKNIVSRTVQVKEGLDQVRKDLLVQAEKVDREKKAALKKCRFYEKQCSRLQSENLVLSDQLHECQEKLQDALVRLRQHEGVTPCPSGSESETEDEQETVQVLNKSLEKNSVDEESVKNLLMPISVCSTPEPIGEGIAFN